MTRLLAVVALTATAHMAASHAALMELAPPSFSELVQLDSQQMAAAAANPQNIDGKIKLNGEIFNVVCDCSKGWKARVAEEVNSTRPECHPPSKFKIKRVDSNPRHEGQLTPESVREFLGLPSELGRVNVRQMHMTSFDTRSSAPRMSSVGGDAGEFVLALQAYASATNAKLGDEDVERLFRSYLNVTSTARTFYIHTSDTSIERLKQQLQVESLNLAEPAADPAELRARLLGDCRGVVGATPDQPCGLLDPLNVGDVNLKLMLQHHGKFLVDPALVRSAIRAFYTVLWDKKDDLSQRVRWEQVSSIVAHPERAVVNLMGSKGCQEGRIAYTVRAVDAAKGLAVFINNEDAVVARRLDLATFFSRAAPAHRVASTTVYRLVQMLGQRMYTHTVSMLANGLPIFDVYVL